jgi:hypothetical protein
VVRFYDTPGTADQWVKVRLQPTSPPRWCVNLSNFRTIFTEDMSGLYLLSFLLAGYRDQAEKRFVAGIRESTKGNPVFKEWARS